MTQPEPDDFHIPSNEKIIDDLTKDLKSQCIDSSEKSDDESEKFESDHEEEPKPKPVAEDFIDEEVLKETEGTLSEEDKLSRKKEAEELKQKGNTEFKNSLFKESIITYTTALRLCPLVYEQDRSILYSNRSASKIKLDLKETALEDLKKALELNPNYVKALLRRAKLYETMEKLDESLEDYKKLQTLDPSNSEVNGAIYSLTIRIEKRNEEMKTEMLGKLKDLGNLFLKPFGLSTENFQLNQDPNSGGYSINFNQNKK